MALIVLDEELVFPPVSLAEPEGLLAIGGDLSKERLLLAYRSGIFPWYENGPILWWSPDPRFVLFPQELRVTKSMQQVIRKEKFEFSVDRDFSAVIAQCKTIPRKGQGGTWITEEVKKAYGILHQSGFAHSAEAWSDHELLGGLYGVRLGNVFFGESMFSKASNASKFAFIKYIGQLSQSGVELIDCQVYTEHLESLGARMIPRAEFMEHLNRLV
jgi:leucyl/phenylalanyl-tRNA---protein transferase